MAASGRTANNSKGTDDVLRERANVASPINVFETSQSYGKSPATVSNKRTATGDWREEEEALLARGSRLGDWRNSEAQYRRQMRQEAKTQLGEKIAVRTAGQDRAVSPYHQHQFG